MRSTLGRPAALLALLVCGFTAVNGSEASAARRPRLKLESTSRSMVWTGIVVRQGAILASGPRWAGTEGPSLIRIVHGVPMAYPDAEWNSWGDGEDASHRFVNVNAIHQSGSSLFVVDTGSPRFGGDPLPGGAKLVRIDMASGRAVRVYQLDPGGAKSGSYVDDVRVNGHFAYLTDAGRPGLIVVDLTTGAVRRVLDGHPAATAEPNRDIVVSGKVLRTSDGRPARVNADPLELSPDRAWLYFGPLEGPWSRVPTALLDDPATSPETLAAAVEAWADLPPTGGTAMDARGNLYFSDLAHDAIMRRSPDGRTTVVVRDPRLHWVDALFLDGRGGLWLPVAQLDRTAPFSSSGSSTRWPIELYRVEVSRP